MINFPLPRSLMNRLMLSAFLVLLVFLSLTVAVLFDGYRRNLEEYNYDQLGVQLFNLLAIVEVEDSELQIGSFFSDQRLNQKNGDLIAIVYNNDGERIWDSFSSKLVKLPDLPISELGDLNSFKIKDEDKNKYLAKSLTVLWEEDSGKQHLLTFVTALNERSYRDDLIEFFKQLLLGAIAVSVFILLFQGIILFLGFRSFSSITSDLADISKGRKDRLDGSYPTEMESVGRAINQLIINERAQKDRYQRSLDDLAHSLKTPLSVLQSYSENLTNKDIYAEQIERIDQIISYQLQRAIRSAPVLSAHTVNINETINEITSALNKVYRNKEVQLNVTVDSEAKFFGEKNDLMELLGNLLDNAYKLCETTILIEVLAKTTRKQNYQLIIKIEDDGIGIPEEERKFILQRGSRADTLNAGQGIGLAIVVDIVNTYRGHIHVEESKLGGAVFTLEFNHALL